MIRHKTLLALDLEAMDLHELWALHGALCTVRDVAAGLLCQPCLCVDNDGPLNKAGEALDVISDEIRKAVENIEAVASVRTAADDQEQLLKFATIAARQIDSFDSLNVQIERIAALAREAVRP